VLRSIRITTILFALVVPARAQTLTGVVLDSVSHAPVVGARILLLDSAGTAIKALTTSSDGQFTFSIPHLGDYRLLIGRIGYPISISKPFVFSSAFTARVSLSLPSNPITLDTVTVVARQIERRMPYLVDAGFYKRRQEGFGHFLTRADIDKRDPRVLTDLLQGISGVRVSCQSGFLTCDADMRAARSMFYRGKCRPTVVIDGVVVRAGGVGSKGDLFLDQLINPFNVEVLEVYPSPAGVPVQYSGYLSPCGAILIWSRR